MPPFEAEAVEEALTAVAEASKVRQRGFANLALPLVERAERLFHHYLGAMALQILQAQRVQVIVLLDLGRASEALPIAQAVAAASAAHPSLGPCHPYTLASHHLVTALLTALD